MPTWLATFLTKLITPWVEKLAALIIQKIQEARKAQTDEMIVEVIKSSQPKNDEERIALARKVSDIIHRL